MKRRVFEEMEYSVHAFKIFKFIGCKIKFFWFCFAEINVANGFFWSEKNLFAVFCLKKLLLGCLSEKMLSLA